MPILRLRFNSALAIAGVVILALLPALPIGQYWLIFMLVVFLYLAMANMWNLLGGYSGLVSLGQPAFVGLGGYMTAVIAMIGLSPFLGVLAGGAAGGAFALLISIPVFRMRGMYFAVGTLVMASALELWFLQWIPPGAALGTWGGSGLAIKAASEFTTWQLYYSALIVGVGSMVLLRLVLNSKIGLGLIAIRDNETTASTSGVNVFRLKLYSFLISAIITGIAGGGYYLYQGYIGPSAAFSIEWTIILLSACILGGIRTFNGPFVGVVITVELQQFLARYTGIDLLVMGAIVVLVITVAPKGVLGMIQGRQSPGTSRP